MPVAMLRPSDVRVLRHDSRLLRGNAMGDPAERWLPVYVPPGYDPKRAEPYPVVFLLAGWSGRGARYLEDGGAFSPSLPERLDRMVAAGELPPTLVVFPDCSTRLGASQYVNSAANGPYMDYLADELVDFVDATFHTHRSADFRGVMGHSSGGSGALAAGMLRPDRFRYVCSSAGDGIYQLLYVHPIPTMIRCITKAGGVAPFIERFLASPNPMGLLGRDEGETMMCLSMSPCYAPNLDVPVLRGDLWFDLETGELVPHVWEKFLAWDPVLMVDRYAGNLRELRHIHLEAGTEDEYGLHLAHRQIAARLRRQGLDPIVGEYPGRHSGHHHRMADRLARMVGRMTGG
jgi:enterochelin esterase family protein